MAEMTSRARVRAALAGHPVDRPPVSLWGHEFLREWSAADLVSSTLDLYRPYRWDFIKFNPRATYFAEAWGSEYEPPSEPRQPRPVRHAVEDAAGLARIEPVDATTGVFGEHLEALRTLIAAVGDVDVLHTVFSPLSVAAFLMGAPQKFIDVARSEPAVAHRAIDAVTTTLAAYSRAAIEAGASGLFFAPLTWMSRDTCDETFYNEFGRPGDMRVLEAVAGATFNVLHVCRDNNMLMSMLDYPVAALNWADRGAGNPSLAEVREKTSKAVMGGIDHARIHRLHPDEVAAQAREAMESVESGLFVTGGCAIPPQTPAENRRALVDAVR
jgi:uroporphyrinogen decarboxylase